MTPFRLAFREEGQFVNCYLAPMETMQGSILLGSLLLKVLDRPGMFEEYKELMRKWATLACEDILGAAPAEFIEERAPEHERAGKA